MSRSDWPWFSTRLPFLAWCARGTAIAMMVGAGALVGACDTENPTSPQGGAQQVGAENGGQTARQRYRIVRDFAGEALPDAPITAPRGVRGRLSELSGKPVVLNIWATWCAPCVEELPTLDRLATQVGDRATVVALSQDLGTQNVPDRFLAQRGWRAIAGWHDPENLVGTAVGGNLPTTILYDALGAEVLRVVGPLDWAGEEARALLDEAGVPSG